jgi:hypothetical protein
MNDVELKKTDDVGANASATCPSDGELGLFVERRLSDPQMAAVAEHLAECPACRESVRDVADWLASGQRLDVEAATLEDRDVVRRALAEARAQRVRDLWQRVFNAVKPTREYLAAADGQTADQIQQRNARAGILHFSSKTQPPHKDAWHVKVTFPAGGSDEANIRLQVFDVDERAVPSGVLTFCGIDLDIDEGYAFMPMGEFRKNMRVALIALRRGDGESVPGELTAAHGI